MLLLSARLCAGFVPMSNSVSRRSVSTYMSDNDFDDFSSKVRIVSLGYAEHRLGLISSFA